MEQNTTIPGVIDDRDQEQHPDESSPQPALVQSSPRPSPKSPSRDEGKNEGKGPIEEEPSGGDVKGEYGQGDLLQASNLGTDSSTFDAISDQVVGSESPKRKRLRQVGEGSSAEVPRENQEEERGDVPIPAPVPVPIPVLASAPGKVFPCPASSCDMEFTTVLALFKHLGTHSLHEWRWRYPPPVFSRTTVLIPVRPNDQRVEQQVAPVADAKKVPPEVQQEAEVTGGSSSTGTAPLNFDLNATPPDSDDESVLPDLNLSPSSNSSLITS